MDEYYSPKEIATLLKVNVITVRRWIDKGKLPAIKLDKDLRVNKKDLNNFIEQRRVNR